MALDNGQVDMDDVMAATFIGTFTDRSMTIINAVRPLSGSVNTMLAPALSFLGSFAFYGLVAWSQGQMPPVAKIVQQGMASYGQSQGNYNITDRADKAREDRAEGEDATSDNASGGIGGGGAARARAIRRQKDG